MIKLLKANFYRLKKNKIFYLFLLFTISYIIFLTFTEYRSMTKYNNIIFTNDLLFKYSNFIGILISIFTIMFNGSEHFDGIIKNKIIIGHKKSNIYLSNLITNIHACIFIYIIYIVLIGIIGSFLFNKIIFNTELFIKLINVFLLIISYSSIFTFITMNITSEYLSSIINILLSFIFIILSLMYSSKLSETKYNTKALITDNTTNTFTYIKELNPSYPSKKERKLYKFLLNINPSGISYQLNNKPYTDINILIIYSSVFILLSNFYGIIIFKKKEFT